MKGEFVLFLIILFVLKSCAGNKISVFKLNNKILINEEPIVTLEKCPSNEKFYDYYGILNQKYENGILTFSIKGLVTHTQYLGSIFTTILNGKKVLLKSNRKSESVMEKGRYNYKFAIKIPKESFRGTYKLIFEFENILGERFFCLKGNFIL
jgi:hypothetical protein